jgi:hypothetical protein
MSADTTGILQLASNNGTVALTISTSQNVGIGTSSPTTPLDVQKAAGANFVATFQNTTAATPYCVFIKDAASSTAGYPLLAVTDSTGASTYLRVDSSNGNVGIGTTPSSYKLDVSNTSATLVRFQSTNANGAYLDMYNGSNTPLYVGFGPTLLSGASTSDGVLRYKSGNSLIFSQAGSDVARFNDGGSFLVGTTSTAGSVSNYGLVLGGVFRSFSGQTASTASGTYVTLFTASSGTIACYLVTVWISADDVNNYQANVIVNTQAGSSTKVSVIVAGSLLQFQMSGYALQARQNSGGSAPISYSAMRISA